MKAILFPVLVMLCSCSTPANLDESEKRREESYEITVTVIDSGDNLQRILTYLESHEATKVETELGDKAGISIATITAKLKEIKPLTEAGLREEILQIGGVEDVVLTKIVTP